MCKVSNDFNGLHAVSEINILQSKLTAAFYAAEDVNFGHVGNDVYMIHKDNNMIIYGKNYRD